MIDLFFCVGVIATAIIIVVGVALFDEGDM